MVSVCLPSDEICMQVRKQKLELDMEQQTGFKSGKVYVKAVYCHPAYLTWASLVAQMVKRLPAMWETRVRSLGREDPLEKEMATHSRALAWKISWMEEPGRL